VESVLEPREESWLKRRRNVSVMYFCILQQEIVSCTMSYTSVYLFQDADRMLGKKKEYWHYGNNNKLKRPI